MRILLVFLLTATAVLARPRACSNLGNDDCANGWLPNGSDDDDYLGGDENPGKRCANLGSDDCAQGWLPGGSNDDDYLGSDDNPGKRHVDWLAYQQLHPELYRQMLLMQIIRNMQENKHYGQKHG